MNEILNSASLIVSTNIDIPLLKFILNMIFCGIFAQILTVVYVKYGNSLSNRKIFSKNFITISMTTALIITIVKSSLALSLGLVGALSIIRFRAAIKEPEELAYLFITISLGLGFGANQGLITSVGFVLICLIIYWRKETWENESENLNLHLSNHS